VVEAAAVSSLCMACFLGLAVPAVLGALKLDPLFAAGPLM
jgi:Mg/Co/Ni transporter MgtE